MIFSPKSWVPFTRHRLGRLGRGLLFLLDLGRDAHHAGGSHPGESAGEALCPHLHVLCTECFRALDYGEYVDGCGFC